MNGFYNPYMKKPDYGQGFQDIANMVMQMIMISKMFPQQAQQQQQLGQTQVPPGRGNTMGNIPAQAPGTLQSGAFPNINPAMLQQLMSMMGSFR